MEFKANFNDIIEVELTEYGFEVLTDYYNSFHKINPTVFKKVTVDEIKARYRSVYGKTKFRVWEFMEIFGKELYLGNKMVCDLDFKIII